MGDFETADPETLQTVKETYMSASDHQCDLVCAACGLSVAGLAEGFSALEDGV